MRISVVEAWGALAICVLAGLIGQDSLLGLSLFVLLLGIKLVWTDDGLFVLPAAYAFHWIETSIGLVYRAMFGREVPTFYNSNYQPMVLIALGCCLALAAGMRLGMVMLRKCERSGPRPDYAFSFAFLVIAYAVATSLEGTIVALAGDYPSLRQIIVTADTARLGVLFLVLRRLLAPRPRWTWITVILVVEVILGVTGFFAGFREPLVLATLAVLEVFDRRNLRHWTAMAAASVAAVGIGLVWMGIRGEYRRNYVQIDHFDSSRSARLRNVQSLSLDFLRSDSDATWQTADKLVDRMWAVYYPALALERVPSHQPHTNGEIFSAALVHIVTPRVFFPYKPELPSDSEKVRKYSGMMVAGAEQNTSIAFGYAAESYIDYGLPLMFLPVFGFGTAVGCLYVLFRRWLWHREIFVAFGTVAFWMSVYLFERSWATMLGITAGMMVYLGLPVLLLDEFLLKRIGRVQHEGGPLVCVEQHPSHIG